MTKSFRLFRAVLLSLFVLPGAIPLRADCPNEADLIVYGGTSGGVVAAVSAARLGKSVILLAQNGHVGGMSASGLGVTDRGNTVSIGGVAREFYLRVGQRYGSASPVYFFEPHVAENVFWQMLAEAGVPVHTNKLLASVTMAGQRLATATMEDGSVYRGKMFVDTSYEGDLMAAAGVTFTFGREGTNTYAESLAGIRSLGGGYNYDPYVTPGNPASGLLKYVQSGTGGTVGQGDQRVQAYNFRLCLTQNATNKVPIAPPTNYSAADFELFARYVEARLAQDGSVSLAQLMDIQTIIPNGKTDINARDELSTDWVGGSYTWATNTHAGRTLLRQQHEDYIRGMFTLLASSPRVPLTVRSNMQTWGLAKDEFTDTGGWPFQIYVREARRMVSDYVMIQHNADGRRTAPDPIALASYVIDSHGLQRVAAGGFTRWEGSIGGSVPFPYGVSYRAIIPRVGECENLLCPFALSASHVAFGSIRMEPVFMMLSQSAANAAALALEKKLPVQQLSYPELAARLKADGQILVWESASYTTNGIILDEDDAATTKGGAWTYGANAGGWNADYYHDGAGNKGSSWVRYTPTLPTNGTYEVYAWWVENANRAPNVPYDIIHAAGTNRVLVNQRLSSAGWFKLLTTNFTAGSSQGVILRNQGTVSGQYVIADAIRFLPVGTNAPPVPKPIMEIVATDAVAGEWLTNTARFAFVRSGDTSAPVVLQYAITGNASNGTDYAALSGTLILAAGTRTTTLVVTPKPDTLVEGDETVTLTLFPATTYQLSSLSNATVTLRDRPFDSWRKAQFNPAELLEPTVSGVLADPDGDGLSNLMEYTLGLAPKLADTTNRPFASIVGDELHYTFTRNPEALDVTTEVQTSTDLVYWSSGPGACEEILCEDFAGLRRETWRATAPVSASTTRYLRLRILLW
jgi:hypothetical protein